MAPSKPVAPAMEHTIDRTPEYEEFINKLRDFHTDRGTKFDPEPKVGNGHIDLLKVFNHVVEWGGYDRITEEKLLWRKVSQELGIFSHNEAAVAFNLKSAYYKNLAAYEIRTVHNKTPPPPEILEEVSAKGGNLLTRTLENYRPRDRSTAQNSPQPSGDDGTPARDSKQEDTPSSGRAARGLRQAPPQRVIFQPDTGPTRPSRHASAQHASNTSAANSASAQTSNPNSHANASAPSQALPAHIARGGASASFVPQNYELHSSTITNFQPPSIQPLALRPVETPGNAPAKFLRRYPMAAPPVARQAPIPSIHHLMKISYERGDRYKFEGFPGLAEGLVDVALKVGELFYDIKWVVSYDPEADGDDITELDGINGTQDILERIAQLVPRSSSHDQIHPAGFADKIVIVTEAAMAIRNMVMLPENSRHMADFPPLRDLLCIILHLPPSETSVELKHIALDIAEQLTPELILEADDPLYRTLLAELKSADRGCILTSLRALARISMNSSETNKLSSIPLDILELIIDWLMLDDDELLDACLDFLYQYTAVVSNLENLLSFRFAKPEKPESLVKHLARLLSHGAKQVVYTQTLEPEIKIPCSEDVVPLPQDLQERLLAMEEPERCYMWLRCLFEEDAEASITQIAIWTAYQSSFSSRLSQMGKSMISPADFIRNVNHVWATAGAQIIRGPKGENQKFIIKGIRARSRPVDPENEGREYFRCLWTLPGPKYQKCNQFFANAERMFEHIMPAHLGETSDDNGHYANKDVENRCFWAGCNKFATPTTMSLKTFAKHVKTHLAANSAKRLKRTHTVPAKVFSLTFEETLTTRDERNPNVIQPAGIPLSAVLILRNIARNVVKTEAQDEILKEQEKQGLDEKARGWNERLFRCVLPRLHEVMTTNRVMAPNICSLLELIQEQ
ncbi:hypothetical protein M406DRAFT_95050 [Cryphonectria parasitica EP155]|uniref:ARID domain-containing protein n=1 Tax=Cryphonectria parasitica (strain ATCC 38755 / EP155) TaxID=660469 RepID=A0A9P4XVZ6_CRYP1|nr:uncharacterized protein M406DRAFT_95050 [Cryphonectria parasitica EP155]KAF3761785.1 hypothetical protein M406DRAFT_95050 [Cryphonectria parasitica EP155]